jgi:three-Cys-motif partner protein
MKVRDEHGELPEVGHWAERKYELLENYLVMFSTGMRKKWRTRVYLDLFAGAGRALIEGRKQSVPTSALIALGVKHPFDRYVFCEGNQSRMKALRARVTAANPAVDVRFVAGDCNREIDRILGELPAVQARGVLTACFVDPYAVSDLKFVTLKRLADGRRVDFLVLVPSHMDANRNEARLTRETDPVLDEFLGSRGWRARWAATSRAPAPPSFGVFLVTEFARSMQALGYRRFDPRDAALVDARGIPLYHLALFSKNPRGADFWKKAKRSASRQPSLFEE